MVPIKVSSANAGGPSALIETGISAGDQVVIDGQLKLRPGVTVKAAAAAPSVATNAARPVTPPTAAAAPPATSAATLAVTSATPVTPPATSAAPPARSPATAPATAAAPK
jgi:hypothetical protein